MTRTREAGISLIEVIVAVAILGIVIGVMTEPLIMGFRTTADAEQRVAESVDAQHAASWFVTDVQSAETFSSSDTSCGGAGTLLRMQWLDVSTTKVASYVEEVAGTQRRLRRRYCEGGALRSDNIVAAELKTTPVINCFGACSSATTKVEISFREQSDYVYTLSATRRVTP